MRCLAMALGLLLGIADATAQTPANAEATIMSHALTPSADLLAWLGRQGGARVRLPVRLQFADQGRLALGPAHVGAWDEPAPDGISLTLDDTALGISLLDRARELCPAGEQACALWVEGTWGPLIGEPDPAKPTLAVREVGGLVDRALDPGSLRAARAVTSVDQPAQP